MVNFCIKIEVQVCARLWAGFCSNILGIYVDFRCWYVWQGTKDFGYLDSTCSTVGSWVSRTPRCPLMYLSSEVTVSITVTPAVGFGTSRCEHLRALRALFLGVDLEHLGVVIWIYRIHMNAGDLRVQWSPHPYRLADCRGMWVYGVYSWKFVRRPTVFMSRSQLHHACQNLKPFGGIYPKNLGKPNIPRPQGSSHRCSQSGISAPRGVEGCCFMWSPVMNFPEFSQVNLVKNVWKIWRIKNLRMFLTREASVCFFTIELHRLRFIPSRDLSKIFLYNAPDEAQRIYFHSDDGDALQKEWLVYLGFSSSKTSRDFGSLSFRVTVSFSGSADRYLKP